MERFRNRQKAGFTLVELALVLVIIGLLITGVLKGEALIQNAKVKNLVNQKDALVAAFYTFYDKYGQYPGDENMPTNPTGDTNNGNADGMIAGNEVWYDFQDLVLAGIINGNYTGVANSCPKNAFGGQMYIQYTGATAGSTTNMNSNCVVMLTIPEDVASQIDLKYDDGVYNTGSIRANSDYTTGANKTMYWHM
jgi:prepilin-type N-terminal cleavage/methylation domain-containing protein